MILSDAAHIPITQHFHQLTNTSGITLPMSKKSRSLNFLDPSGPAWPITGELYLYLCITVYICICKGKGKALPLQAVQALRGLGS